MTMTKERFEQTEFKCSYEEYLKCNCSTCKKKTARRYPIIDGGLGLCPNLKAE